MKNFDAKYVPYPCNNCDIAECREKNCRAWRSWFFAKWIEVTRIFKR